MIVYDSLYYIKNVKIVVFVDFEGSPPFRTQYHFREKGMASDKEGKDD